MGDKNNKKGGTFASAAPNGDETKDRAWSVVVGPKRRGEVENARSRFKFSD